ncbi:MAG: sigma-70 family RNA polymerase sigma factor [Pyrinomonadaceae bacterium]|nr:sigma-70 family RNA polymerase sigma factor [Pyrinomonadaceae bacterium]
MSSSQDSVTRLLVACSNGQQGALDQLFPLVYLELRRQAARHMRLEKAGHTLQPTALIHEVYLRLVNQRDIDWQGRAQFFAASAEIMRRILIDHARRKLRDKRGGSWIRLPFEETEEAASEPEVNPLALNEALEKLAELDHRQSQVVMLKYFGGRTIEEIAADLKISPATVKREWKMAKTWLRLEISKGDQDTH